MSIPDGGHSTCKGPESGMCMAAWGMAQRPVCGEHSIYRSAQKGHLNSTGLWSSSGREELGQASGEGGV